ncbi:hypothetical protein CkaCkLH20_00737 [Colletotrichum karsti]|uniref:Uncharacterized protein n=1 Tax=Colletotrichum karsti TaxID=1095194 RepID=A0A9P6IGF4_9PEZI|nr:uncharacterized protein CkaCkLH20_00737 [Colletotrichum karsti]KAF9881591.1 hypothetical protein CkaCkLH20_00737 [Colletotrichum karsti]
MQNLTASREGEAEMGYRARADEEHPSKRPRFPRTSTTIDSRSGAAWDLDLFGLDNSNGGPSDEPHFTAYIKSEEQPEEELPTTDAIQATIDLYGASTASKVPKNSVPTMRDCKLSMTGCWQWPRVSTDTITDDQALALDYLVELFNRDPNNIILSASKKHESLKKVYTRRSKTINELGYLSSHAAIRAVRSSLRLNRQPDFHDVLVCTALYHQGPPAKWKKYRYIMDVFRFSSYLVNLQQAPNVNDDTFAGYLQHFNLVRYHHPKLDRLRAEPGNEIGASQQQHGDGLNKQEVMVPKRDYDDLKARFDRLQDNHNSLLREIAGLQRRFDPFTSSGGYPLVA